MTLKKNILGILFSFALMMVMLPMLGMSQPASADDPTSYNLWVGGTEVTSATTSGEGWRYAVTDNTLTLENATIGNGHSISGNLAGIYYNGSEELNIVLEGTNSIDLSSSSENTYGVYSSNGNIKISGDGSLSINVNYTGIYAGPEHDITIDGGDVTATVTGSNGNAIHSSRHVDIEGGTVTATGGDVAVHAFGQVKLVGGSVTASGTTRGIDAGASYGVDIGKSVIVWAGDDKDKAADVTQTFATNHNYKWVQTETATLWVGGIPVTSRNASDILGDRDEGATASYDYDTETLTLNNYSYVSEGHVFGPDNDLYAAIYADQDLEILLKGDNTVKCTKKDNSIGNGIHVAGENGDLIITGNGTLTASAYGNGQGGTGVGIYARNGDIEFNGGTVNALGDTGIGISTDKENGYVRINSGIVTASGSDRGFSGSYITVAGDMGINAGDSKETAIYVDKDSFDKDHRQNWVQISKAYPLWVRGTLVMDANKGDVLGDGKVSYDPETGTLKLDGANITADPDHQYKDAAIYYEGKDKDLTINAAKASTVTATGEDSRGIYTKDKNLIFNGTLNVTGGDDGVDCNGNDITVNGKLTASGSEIGIYLDSGDITINSGAELYASGSNNSGIGVNDNTGSINIKEGARVTAVGGKYGAISGIVKNAIAGTAWTDKYGTTGETAIEVNANRDLGDTYKKVQFPASQYTITYDLSGGTLDGQTGTVTKKVDAGAVIKLPAPVRDGYTFDYWQGSKYKAGEKYTVNGDHTFKAVWKTAAGGDGSRGGSSKKGVNTGDENTFGAWIALLAAALGGTAGMVFARKRKK